MCEEPLKKSISRSKLIHSIYIFNNQGICLLRCSLEDNPMDADITTGFFTAIKDFSSELIPGTEVKSLILSGYKLFYNNYDNITFAIQCSEETPDQIVRFILDEISNTFLRLYGEELSNWNGNLNIFESFKNYVVQFLEESLVEKILEDFGYKLRAEGLILFDEKGDKIIFSKLPSEISSKKKVTFGGMLINFAKNLSLEFKGGPVESILISAENKWICVAKKENIYIIALFPKFRNIELEVIISKTDETLENVLKLLKI